ncbi:MAG TPA: hypothetical protein PK861_00360 [Thermomonas sp.]|nr:hypothetical protein [Thermomonas sp.]
MSIADCIIARITRRPPDFVIGGQERPYLRRWFVIPRNRFFNVYLHQFLRSDDDRALHDHPWLFNASWLLRGAYREHTIKAGGLSVRTLRQAGAFKFRWGAAPHRVELLTVADYVTTQPENLTPLRCWTIFITGPRVRQWGFYCMERGWIHWERFTAPNDKGAVGPGCEA